MPKRPALPMSQRASGSDQARSGAALIASSSRAASAFAACISASKSSGGFTRPEVELGAETEAPEVIEQDRAA